MSAAEKTKTTTVFDRKLQHYQRYSILVKGEFITKEVQVALGPEFAKAFLASENVSGQTAKQKEAIKSNITGMGLLTRTNKS